MQEKLTINELLLILRTGKHKGENLEVANNIVIKNYTIEEQFSYFGGLNEAKQVTFIGCNFEDVVTIKTTSNLIGIYFKNCIFEKEVSIQKLRCGLQLDGSVFQKDVELNSEGLQFLRIADILVFQDFSIKGSFQERLEIQDVNLRMSANDMPGNLILSALYCNLAVTDSKFKTLLLIGSGVLNGKCVISNLSAAEFEIRNYKLMNRLTIENCNLEKVTVGPFGQESIGLLLFNENPRIDNAHFLLATINDASVTNTNFGKLTLSGNHTNKMIIENSLVDWLQIKNVFNQGTLSLSNVSISKDGKLEIKSSNLGKADVLKCNFSQALLDFENSKIAEIFSSATTFPRRPAEKTNEQYSQAQLAYGQLAASFAKQGDTVRTYTYQSYEIEAHFKNTHWWSRDFFTWLNLGLNKISNNFGRWWALGVVFTFAVGWIFFYSLLLSTNEVTMAFNFIPDWKLVISFLKFMNPLRTFDTEAIFKTNNQPYLTLTGIAYLLDFVGRIFIAYGFYQTIQAFRRFGRK